MDTRKVTTEYRLAKWAQLLQERASRGQSINEFCEVTGISRNTYFYWQRKLRTAACQEYAEQERSIVPNGWARLEAAQEPPSTTVTVEIGSYRVNATATTNLELLAKICHALKTI